MDWAAFFANLVGAGLKYGPPAIAFIEKEGPVIQALFVAGHDLVEQLKAAGTPDGTAVAKGATLAGGTLLTHIAMTQFPDDVNSFVSSLPIKLPGLIQLFDQVGGSSGTTFPPKVAS